jgi:WD40 repeat protein
VQLWGLEKGYCLRTLLCPSSCNALALSADGALLASGHFDGALRFWDVRSGRQAYEVAGLHSQQITSVDAGLRWVGALLAWRHPAPPPAGSAPHSKAPACLQLKERC